MKRYFEMDIDEYYDTAIDEAFEGYEPDEAETVDIKKSLHESYNWLYNEAVKDSRDYLETATILRNGGKGGRSAYWMNQSVRRLQDAIRYKRTMNNYK